MPAMTARQLAAGSMTRIESLSPGAIVVELKQSDSLPARKNALAAYPIRGKTSTAHRRRVEVHRAGWEARTWTNDASIR